jgi:hypothetical protein
MNVDFPAMFGPVIISRLFSEESISVLFGMNFDSDPFDC